MLSFFFFLCSGVVSTVVQDSPHKIFIGGLPNYLNEDQVCLFSCALKERRKEKQGRGMAGRCHEIFIRLGFDGNLLLSRD